MAFPQLPKLTDLITRGGIIRLLPDLLGTIFGGGDIKAALQAKLMKSLDKQAGRSSGAVLGRTICEAVDTAMETKAPGATVDQAVQVGEGLAQNAALQLTQAAEIVLGYPAKQAAVVRAKAGQGDLAAARAARDAETARVKDALRDVARVVAGQKPEDK